ncbi:MAG TPA: Rieske 2Fe-2S domain-containing protein [Caulobacteraceae bacterium]|nr:Rieske 2Fe-2S domain-containing protein [Caulobacteraceae bacterium]
MAEFEPVMALEALQAKGKAVARRAGRQILLVASEGRVFACANRCPHEGYPLSEGVLSNGAGRPCVLTCNWHNWKFDLSSGETLVGGDTLERFPVRIEGGQVLVDLTPPPLEDRRAKVRAGLAQALADEDQDRLVREAARLSRLEGDAVGAVALAIDWGAARLEFGTTHAIGGASEWLAVHDERGRRPEERLAAIGEILGNVADNCRGAPPAWPFAAGEAPWSEAAFLAAIEAEDEPAAVRLVRGFLPPLGEVSPRTRSGATKGASAAPADLAGALYAAALAHYQDFGHSLIYAVNTVRLVERLGPGVAEPLLLMLARSLVYARREDLLPEFRDYARRLAAYGERPGGKPPPLSADALSGRSTRQSLALVSSWGGLHSPQAIFETLVEAAARVLLTANERRMTATAGKIADNVGWLDFTHSLTFANAGRVAMAARPDLAPAVLLQLACFQGRNAAYVDPAFDPPPFAVDDRRAFASRARERLFDHGEADFIMSVHYVKTLLAAEQLAEALPRAAPTLLAAVNRFLFAPKKRRDVLRTARQMRAFVAAE